MWGIINEEPRINYENQVIKRSTKKEIPEHKIK